MNSGKLCQSCGMPLGTTDEFYGSNGDGTKNDTYCKYCFEEGAFIKEETMEEMLESCIPHVVEGNGMTETAARKLLEELLPQLERWKKS